MNELPAKPVRFARSARRHKIGRVHTLHVMNTATPEFQPATEKYGEQWVWLGRDDRGVELVVIAVEKPDVLLVIHVQPTGYEHQEPEEE